jgi:hypothetical protein
MHSPDSISTLVTTAMKETPFPEDFS